MKTKLIIALAILALLSIKGQAAFVGTEFTYQGRLTQGTGAANGSYDFTFTLHFAASGGVPIVTVTNLNAPVSNGLFTATVDFGGGVYNGSAYWISLGVRSNGTGGAFTALTPRQPLTPTPNASYASLAGTVPGGSITANKLAVDSVTVFALQSNAVTAAKVAAGQLVKSVNGLRDDVVLSAGSNLTITPSGNTLTIAASSSGWKLGGNAGTIAGTDFLGTADNQPLEVKVDGVRALRIQPYGGAAPSLVGGYHQNGANFGGAAIAGGGTSGSRNEVQGNYGFIGAGHGGRAGAFSAVVGGAYNTAPGEFSFIGSGFANANSGTNAVIGGGTTNVITADGLHAFIGGGAGNQATNFAAVLGGGRHNVAGGAFSTVSGGSDNHSGADFATVGGGLQNMSSGDSATVSGGRGNRSIGDNATVGGGVFNVSGAYATVGGGDGNASSAENSTVSGGYVNRSTGLGATVGGGVLNTSSGWEATVAGGRGNIADGFGATVGGGEGNLSLAGYATVPGGRQNLASGLDSFAAGRRAQATNDGTFVWADSTDADFASTAANQFSIRATGGVRLSDSTPNLSFGMTTRQMLNLWGTQYGLGVQTSTLYFRTDGTQADHGFAWFKGGIHSDAKTNSGGGATLMRLDGTGLTVNGTVTATAFNPSSDRNLKENFAPVSPRDVLAKVSAMPISRWNFKGDTATPHVGPMAQDFHAAFGLGTDDKHIATVDADGVALAAIQGLNQKVEAENKELRSALVTRDAELAGLKERLARMERILKRITKE